MNLTEQEIPVTVTATRTAPAVTVEEVAYPGAVAFRVPGGALIYGRGERWFLVLVGRDPEEVPAVEAVAILAAAFRLAGAAAA